MGRYAYVARSAAGSALRGEVTAETEQEAARLLRADGKFVINLEVRERGAGGNPRVEAGAARFGRSRVRTDDVVLFLTQLSIMVETGVALIEALQGIIEQTPVGRFREVLIDLLRGVEGGLPFSAALARHPRVFAPMFVNLVRAAEASGALGPMLKRCAEHVRYQREVRRRVASAMAYPLLLVVAAVGVTVFVMTYVLPRFTEIYVGKEAMLPMPTQALIAVSDGMMDHWKGLLPAALLMVVGVCWFFRSTTTRRYAHAVLLRLPILGRMLHKSFLTSSLRTLGMLVDSGVSMLEAVAMTRTGVNNHYFEKMWSDVDARLHRGEQLSAPLYQNPLMPRPVVQMIEAGERAGRLGPVLQRLADHLDQDLQLAIKNGTQMIEPIMIGVMGAVVGGIAIALLLPILSISKVIGQ